jgi:hypothetical protein
MPEIHHKSTLKNHRRGARRYDAEAQGLLSLRLIAAPDPKDDLSDAQLREICLDPNYSPELIQHLIDVVKAL